MTIEEKLKAGKRLSKLDATKNIKNEENISEEDSNQEAKDKE